MLSHQFSGLIILLFFYLSCQKHFRLIVIKYADRGLVQTGGLASKLFNQLYILSTCTMTILLSLMLLARIWRSIGDDHFSQEEAFLLAVRHSLYKIDKDQYITPEMGNFFITNIYLFMILFNVHYLKRQKSELRKRKNQRNIITFHTNTKFFMFFLWISLPVYILKSLSFQQPSTSRPMIRNLVISLHLIKILVICFLRPLVIIHLLKKNMPSFFIDSPEEPQIKSFFITGQSFHPRPVNFCPLKPFCQNARWGWMYKRTNNIAEIESKHEKENIFNLSCNICYVPGSSNSMPDIDI